MEKIDFQNDILILESQKYEIQLVHIRNELNKTWNFEQDIKFLPRSGYHNSKRVEARTLVWPKKKWKHDFGELRLQFWGELQIFEGKNISKFYSKFQLTTAWCNKAHAVPKHVLIGWKNLPESTPKTLFFCSTIIDT